MIENTSSRDPAFHLLGAMTEGTSGYIEGMEAAGQQQLVESTMLPVEINCGSEGDVVALGIELGDVDKADPLFRSATLPEDWKKTRTDHAMWSNVVDEYGRTRLRVFYKAAYYDRKAAMSVNTVYGYAGDLIDGAPLVLDEEWATARAVIEAVGQHRDNYVKYDEGRDDDYWAEQIEACDRIIERVALAVKS